MKKYFKIKTAFFLLILTLGWHNINAQMPEVDSIEIGETYHYCNIVNYRCYFGSNKHLYQSEEEALKNIKERRMDRITEEMNIMSRYGWEFVIAYSTQDFSNSTPYAVRVYRKKVIINKISSETD